jgi:hypothetical protein
MMTGPENNLPIALEHGMGATLVSGNLFPKQTAAVFQAHREGKDVKATHAKLRDAEQTIRVQGAGGTGMIKYAFTGYGFRESFVRPLQLDLTAGQKASLKPKLEQLRQMA